MKMKKILALLTAIVLMLNMSVMCASAAGSKQPLKDGEADRMYAFGLIRDSKVFEADRNVTRGEAAYAFYRMMGYNAQYNKKELGINDIEKNTNETEIGAVYSAGIMPCVYEKSFLPDSAVSYGDVIRALARLLGYTDNVIGNRDSLDTYIRIMCDAGATGVRSIIKAENDGVKWSEFVNLLDLTLEANLLKVTYSNNETKVESTSDTILNKYLNIYECEGILNKNEYGSLTGNGYFSSDEIQIGNTVLTNNGVHTLEMLGMNIEAWYYCEKNGSGKKELLYMRPRNTKTLKVNSDRIISLTVGELSYDDSNDKTRTVSFPKGIYIVYNGVSVSDYTGWDIKCTDGSVTLIDNDSDGRYDVLSVINYEQCVVYSKGSDKMIYDIHSSERNIDASDEDIKIFKDGSLTSFDAIKAYDVVSAVKSKDGRIIELIITSNAVKGKIAAKKSANANGCTSEVTINGVKFYTSAAFEKVFENTIKIGLEGTFYLDFNGNIVGYSRGTDESVYAYVIKSKYDNSGIEEKLTLKIYTQSGSFEALDTASKVKLNGQTEKDLTKVADAVKPSMVIKYKTNENGNISWIETSYNDPTSDDYREESLNAPEDRLRVTYSTKSDTVTYINAVSMFGNKEKVSNKTIFFKVPLDINETDPTFFAVGKKNMLTDAQKVYIQTYSSSNETLENDVCVVFENTVYSSSSFSKIVSVGLVQEAYTGLDKDNQPINAITLVGNSGTVELQEYSQGYFDKIRAEKTSITETFKLQAGDIIRYILNSQGNVVYAELLCRLNDDGSIEKLNLSHGVVDDYNLEVGYVYKRRGTDIAFVTNEPSSSTKRDSWMVYDMARAKVYIYEDDELTRGTTDDIVGYDANPNEYSKGAIHFMYGQPQVIFIYK